jgi:hypothetical protein
MEWSEDTKNNMFTGKQKNILKYQQKVKNKLDSWFKY